MTALTTSSTTSCATYRNTTTAPVITVFSEAMRRWESVKAKLDGMAELLLNE